MTVGGLHGQLHKYPGGAQEDRFENIYTGLYFTLTSIKRSFCWAPGDTSPLLLAVAKRQAFCYASQTKNKAVVILTLLPVQRLFNGSWSHHLGKQHRGKTKQVTPLAMPSLLVPHSVYKLREANHNFTLWFVKSHSSTGGTKKTFKSINFMAYRITALPYCCSIVLFLFYFYTRKRLNGYISLMQM